MPLSARNLILLIFCYLTYMKYACWSVTLYSQRHFSLLLQSSRYQMYQRYIKCLVISVQKFLRR